MQEWHSTYNSVWGRQTDAAVGTDAEYYDDNVSDPYQQNAAGPAGAATEVGSGESKSHAVWFLVAGMVAVFLLLLALNLFILSNVGSDWEHANRPPDTPDTTLASYLSQGQSRRERGAGERTCSTRACVAAAANVSLDAAANPCNDFFGHVCNNWIRGASEARSESWDARNYRYTMDHAHQAALSGALHKLLAGRAGSRWLPAALRRLYRKCLKPGPEDGAQLRSKLLDSAGVAPWPQPRRDTANAEDVSKVLGNAYYFTNEPAILRMGVGADGHVFLAEPRLLLDGPTTGPAEVAQAADAAFVLAGGQLPPPLDVNRFEKLLDTARRGDEPPPWNTTLFLSEAEPDGGRQRSGKIPLSAWSSWNLRTVIEEAFEPREAVSEVVVRAPIYVDALPDVLKEVKEHELLNYLGLRTALLASRLLPAGPEKQILCRLLDVDDTAPARTATEHCIRMIAKYEPVLALHVLATRSPLVHGLDPGALLGYLKHQLTGLLRAGALDTGNNSLSAVLADRADALPWVGLAPDWLSNATMRQAYVDRFYGERVAPASLSASQTVFAWMQDKMVNEHLALNEPEQFADARWQTGLLSTRCRLVLREEETVATDQGESDEDGAEMGTEATLQVPPAALDLVWATDPSTGMLQVARIGVRSYEPVLRHLFRWLQQHQRASSLRRPERSGCSSWEASPERLDAALESRALSLALRAYLAWPHASELVLPGLEHLGPEQLFFVFYALNQCEANGPDVEQLLASKYKRRDGTARPGRAAWVNGVTSTNEDFARAFQCPPPPKQPNPFQDCSTAVSAAHGGRI
ncbi:uncharacterized protein LOC144095282 [Amblyomma americanum]